MRPQPDDPDELLRPAEVAAMFQVEPKTVTRWATAGRVNSIRTPGGHRRYLKSEMLALLAGDAEGPSRQGVSGPADSLGSPQLGSPQLGDRRTGDRRTGDRRTGDRRTGDRVTGANERTDQPP